MTKQILKYGGLVAGAVLIVFGVVAILMGANGGQTVKSSLKNEYIVGTPDMTPAAITAEAKTAKLDLSKLTIPSCTVANKAINTGATARCFAQYMRIHTFEATGGFTYSQMGIYAAAPNTPKSQLAVGGGTDNKTYAQIDPTTKQPVSNGTRSVWVTETALTTALNVSYMASQLALFGIVVGVALLLSGIGFVILALFTLGAGLTKESLKPKRLGSTAPTPA